MAVIPFPTARRNSDLHVLARPEVGLLEFQVIVNNEACRVIVTERTLRACYAALPDRHALLRMYDAHRSHIDEVVLAKVTESPGEREIHLAPMDLRAFA